MRPSLGLPWHRGTTAHVASIYPFSAQAPSGPEGVCVGVDLLAGGAEFCWDPFDAYSTGAVTNPNVWVLGEPGNGKSALVKSLLWRMAALYGQVEEGGRWLAIADPKGEYVPLAERLGLDIVRLAPGGDVRVNPLAASPIDRHQSASVEAHLLGQAEMVTALVSTVLNRPLTQLEDAALFAAVEDLMHRPPDPEPALPDVARLLQSPSSDMLDRLHRDRGAGDDLSTLVYGLEKLLSRSLRGMFDGPSTVPVRRDGPGLLLDLSAISLDSEAMPLVMVAAAGWLQRLMTGPGPQRVQVLDEAWALLANRHTAAYLQTCFKLGRTYGTANICITHRPSDLGAQADDGSATAKIATGLLADAATKVILRQSPDQLPLVQASFGLTDTEAQIVGQLTRGRALWKIAGRSALVHHLMTSLEATDLCDTDSRMSAGTV